MKKYEENKQLLKSIVTQHKRGYMQTLRYKHPELIDWVNEVTSFANQPNRSFITRIWYVLNDIHECFYASKQHKSNKPSIISL